MYKKEIILFIKLTLISNLFVFGQTISDKNATLETSNLFNNLFKISKTHTLFGHQDDLAYGVNWKYVQNESDIKQVTNDYPALYGWDIGKIEHGKNINLDDVPFELMINYIKETYKKGAINTISWHLDNPLTGGNSWDTTKNTVKSILPNGSNHVLYKKWLDQAAIFISKLKDKNDNPIPILFRPFHEEAGNWFWWCRNVTSSEDYIKLWKFTIHYLRATKKLNNLIVVFNSNNFKTKDDFLKNYPGDEWVDILSFDHYQYNLAEKKNYISTVQNQLSIISAIAKEKNKIVAFAETGFEQIPDSKWWTQTLLPAISNYPVAYVLVWRNAGKIKNMSNLHYYAPYKEHPSSLDFRKFYKNKRMIFERNLSKMKIYTTK